MTKVTMEFDYCEDNSHLKACMTATEVQSMVVEARNYIRSKLKHEECTENEVRMLEQIREILLQVEID